MGSAEGSLVMHRVHRAGFVLVFASPVTLLLVAAAAPFAASDATEERWLVVLDTPTGLVQRVETSSVRDVSLRCTADAPSRPLCTNGPLVATPRVGHGLALPIPSGAGTPVADVPAKRMVFVSFLESASTLTSFRCVVNENALPEPVGTGGEVALACFSGSGSFPPAGVAVVQTAIAFAATTGAASDSVAVDVYALTAGGVLLPGVGKFTAQLEN